MKSLRNASVAAVIALFTGLGCGGSGAPPASPAQDPTVPVPSPAPAEEAPVVVDVVDPVAGSMTVSGIRALCDDHLASAQKILDEIKRLSSTPDDALTYASTLGRVDDLVFEIFLGGGFSGLMNVGHPDKSVRDAAKECRPKVDRFHTNMMLDAEFAGVIKRYAARGEKLEGTKKRLLDELLRDFRRNGLDLPAAEQAKLRAINDELSKLEQDFVSNISDSVLSIEVDPKKLKGLPDEFVKTHPPGDNGKVKLTTNYPDYFPVVTYAEDRTVARDLAKKFNNRAAEANLEILARVLVLRKKKADLLGYETWAHYAVEPRMAKQPDKVQAFLKTAADRVRGPAKKEYAEFVKEYRRRGGKVDKPIPQYERMYLEQVLRKKKYGFDAKKLSQYFEVNQVTEGLLSIMQRLYAVKFVDAKDAPKWHQDVRVLDVTSEGKTVGRIYIDLYPREGKYKHAAMFDLRTGKRLADGRYVPPIAALVCNFPKPGGAAPALMTHQQVQTYFHEFGHTIHHVITQEELASYSGTNTVRDFVEAPSQMLEEWTWKRETLDLFAKHHKTGEKIPPALFKAMTAARAFGRALSTERQLSLATLDFEYHLTKPPFDTGKVFDEVMARTQSFSYQPDTHFEATFGHLMGYDAAYYGYQWALAIARDVLTRFEKDGFMDATVASDWREHVLSRGAGADESELVKRFLGRDWNLDAYAAFLAGK